MFKIFKMIKRRKWKKTIKESGLFDIKYYIFTYPDVRKLNIDPINHYIKFGAKELRNPSSEFNTQFYLKHNHDIHKSGINPLVHYILYGKNEGYSINNNNDNMQVPINNINDTVDNVCKEEILDKQEKKIIADAFDEEYYLTTYPDVANSDISAIDHYYYTGWKEERNPNVDFDTAFYLLSNPDIAQAGINPFFHYISMGRQEGRMCKHPAGYKKIILDRARAPLGSVVNSSPVIQENALKVLEDSLKRIFQKTVVISFSHDKYIDNIGGIQLCISDEQESLNSDNYSYINISPYQPMSVLTNNSDWYGNIIIDGIYIGTFSSKNILSKITTLLMHSKLFLIIHSLHGHNPSVLKELYSSLTFEENYFWIHDYFSLCESHNLLRNNLSYCGAPSIDSQACQICAYGGNHRKQHLEKIQDIFNTIPFTVLSPSKVALDIWLESSNLKYKDVVVHEHRKIESNSSKQIITYSRDKPLRIAFLGNTVSHKGWFIFKELVSRFQDDTRYEFYHLGIKSNGESSSAQFFEVRNQQKTKSRMQNLIQENNIHIAFLWSNWPETYNIVTYETLAAGTAILTNKQSGNIASIINRNEQGIVLDSEKELFEIFKHDRLVNQVLSIFDQSLEYGTLVSSNITAKIILKEEHK